MTPFYNNYLKLDLLDKNNLYYPKYNIKDSLTFFLILQLKFLKKENDYRILNTLNFLEQLTGVKVFIKKISFFFNKKYRSAFIEILFYSYIMKDNFNIISYLNLYFLSYYNTYIFSKKLIEFNLTKKNFLFQLKFNMLNKIFKENKNFKKKDCFVIICLLQTKYNFIANKSITNLFFI